MEDASGAVPKPRIGLGQALAALAQALFYLAYPFVIYLAFTRLETRSVGAILLSLFAGSLLIRARGSLPELGALARQHLGLGLLILLAIVTGHRIVLLVLPGLVSLYLLYTFASSLWRGKPMIERVARMVEDDLPDFCVPYCRKVTVLWCVFLACNTLGVAVLALAAPLEWWALYTGLVFYLVLGGLLAAEFVVRKLWFRYYGDGPMDRLLAWAFPPERTANGRRSLAYVRRRQERAAAIRASA